MKLSDITTWLESSRDFAQGAALYQALGPSATYKRLFTLGKNDYTRQVLARELGELLGAARQEVAPSSSPLPVVPTAVAAPIPPPVDSPVLMGVRRQLKAVRDERSHLHPQLTAKGMRRTERQALAGRIVGLTEEEIKLKAAEAHVVQHGRLPGPVPTAEVTDSGELQRRLHNLSSRRSKLRKDPARAAALAEVEADIILIRNKLVQPNA